MQERAWLAGHQALTAHDLPHQLGRALGLFRVEIGMDAPVPVGTLGLLEVVLDPRCQSLAAGRRSRS